MVIFLTSIRKSVRTGLRYSLWLSIGLELPSPPESFEGTHTMVRNSGPGGLDSMP
jgi:hypothetical protein